MQTQFEAETIDTSKFVDSIGTALGNAKNFLKDCDLSNMLRSIRHASNSLCRTQDFLNKYGDFLHSIDQKFGTDFGEKCNSAKKIVNDLLGNCRNININVSNDRIDIAGTILDESIKKTSDLKITFGKIMTLPHIIDFSKLTHDEWRKIGIAGIHYRSRVFLSYHFRDKDPRKDENQKFIDYYMIPLLTLLNIEPITARTHLKSQGLIEEDTIALVKDCDGIIGFYTASDPIENVEHELSNSQNVIAICKEEGASSPSMRRSRLQLDFRRDEPSSFLIELIRALKDKEMFRLLI